MAPSIDRMSLGGTCVEALLDVAPTPSELEADPSAGMLTRSVCVCARLRRESGPTCLQRTMIAYWSRCHLFGTKRSILVDCVNFRP